VKGIEPSFSNLIDVLKIQIAGDEADTNVPTSKQEIPETVSDLLLDARGT